MKKIICFLLFTSFISSIYSQLACKTPSVLDATLCIECNTGYVLTTDGKGCSPAIANCASYSAPGRCENCIQGYVLSVGKRFCANLIANCENTGYDDAGKCFKCSNGFVPSISGAFCVKIIPNCILYSNLGECISHPECKTYDAANDCTACYNTTHFAISTDKKACVRTRPGCATYDSKGICLTCTDGAKAISVSGLSCQTIDSASCAKVDDAGLCASCKELLKVPASAGPGFCPAAGCSSVCVAKVDNCVNYNAANGDCLLCAVGFSVATDNAKKCVKTIPFCDAHKAAGGCQTCATGFNLAANDLACIKGISNCAIYDPSGKCLICSPQYIFSKSGFCVAAINGCTAHDDTGVCTTCATGLTLNADSTQCTKTFVRDPGCLAYDFGTGNCKACVAGKILSSDFKCITSLVVNPSFCISYTPDGLCSACHGTFKLTVTKKGCAPPKLNCEAYDDNLNCIRCQAGKDLIQDQCYTRVNNCVKYNAGSDACIECVPDFRIFSGNCVKRILNCATYEAATDTCDVCVVGFTKSADKLKCYPSIVGCSTYNDISGRCTACTDAAQKVTNNGQKCVASIADCTNYNDITGGCTLCTGKVLTVNFKCAAAITDCLALADDGKCLLCVKGKKPKTDGSACDPDAFAESIPKILLNGFGQLIYYNANVPYCLYYKYKRPAGTAAADWKLDVQASVDRNVYMAECDKVDYETTLWKFVQPDGTELAAGGKYFDHASATPLQVVIAPYFIQSATPNAAPLVNVAADTSGILRIRATASGGVVLAYDGFTVFDLAYVTGSNAHSLLHKAFSLKILKHKSSTWAGGPPATETTADLAATSAVVGAIVLETDKGKTIVYTAPPVTTTPPATPPKTATVNAVVATNFFGLKIVDTVTGFVDKVVQKITLSDDLITIEWTPDAALTDKLLGIYPVVQGITGKTQASMDCSFRYPEKSKIPFQGSYEPATPEASTGLPEGKNLARISVVGIPIFDLEKCGFKPASYDATTGGSKFIGRIGYYWDGENKGFFKDVEITLGEQLAFRDVKIDNGELFDILKNEPDLTAALRFNSEIRFFQDPGCFREIYPVDSKDPRGLVVDQPLIYVQLNLLNALKAPLKDSFIINKVKPYLQTTFKTGATAADTTTITQELTVTGYNKTKNNTASFGIDLKKVPSGSYKFVISYYVSQFRSAPKTRLLAEERELLSPMSDEEFDQENVKELRGFSKQVKIQLNANHASYLTVSFYSLISMILLILLWKD